MVFQGSPAQTDQVGLAGGQELFRLFSGGNASRKEHRDPGRFFGCPGQFRKIPGFRMAGTEKDAQAPGEADAVQAGLLEIFHRLGQFLRAGASFHIVSAAQPEGHHKVPGQGGTDGLDYFHQEPGATFQGCCRYKRPYGGW